MVAQSAPAVVEHGTLAVLALHVAEEEVVAPPRIAQPLHLLVVEPLLPVEPPEVDAVVHIGMQIGLEESLYELLVAAEPFHSLAVGAAHALGKLLVFLLVGSHAVGGMQVHRGVDALLVEKTEELAIVGEEVFVPVPARPSATSLLADGVPVHVDDEDVERDVVLAKPPHQITEVLVGVAPVAAPPIAKGIARRHRHTASEARIALQGSLVVVAVTHEVPVLSTLGSRPFLHPVPVRIAIEEEALRIIHQRPAVGREQTVLQRNGCAVVAVVAVVIV